MNGVSILRSWRWPVVGLAIGVAALVGACNDSLFRCESDGDCLGAQNGVCQPNGFCSFADEACASGFVYGDLAPDDLAGQCVPESEAGTGTGPGTSGSTPEGSDTAGGTTAALDDDGTSDGDDDSDAETSGATTSGSTGSDDDSSDDSTGESPGCGPGRGCDAPTPICQAGNCVSCDALPDGGCFEIDPTAAVCDAGSGTCVPCTEHSQCFSGACFHASGRCVDPDNRLIVDREAENCAGGLGTLGAPLCTIDEAFDIVAAQAGSDGWAVFVEGSVDPYTEDTVNFPDNVPTALIGATSGPSVRLTGTGVVNVIAQGESYLADVIIDGETQDGLSCGGSAQVWLDDVIIRNHNRNGFSLYACAAAFRRVSITNNNELGGVVEVDSSLTFDGGDITLNNGALRVFGTADLRRVSISASYVMGGLLVDGGHASLTNVMSAANVYEFYGTRVQNEGSVDVVYSTLGDGFTCDDSATGSVRNSIAFDDDCPTLSIDTSAVSNGSDQGAGNTSLAMTEPADIFVNGFDDFHLLPSSSLIQDVAVWTAGDPATDIDGDARPNVDATPDYAGADVP